MESHPAFSRLQITVRSSRVLYRPVVRHQTVTQSEGLLELLGSDCSVTPPTGIYATAAVKEGRGCWDEFCAFPRRA